MYDIIVVGGNLSGATAAINASELGANVLLIEKNKEPINPPRCGEATDTVTSELLNLEEIGCPKNEIRKVIINVSSEKEYVFKALEKKLYIIDRNYVEKYLLKKAKDVGVEVKTGHRMTFFNPPNEIVIDNKNKINGKIIIDATGIRCQIGKKIKINTEIKPQHIGVCIQSRVESIFESKNMRMWFHKPYAPFGYAWLFPKNDKLANIGVGIPGGQKLDLNRLLDNYIKDNVKDKYKIKHNFRSCVPASKPLELLKKDNVLFVGDAARLANPIFENGINNAIFSGSVAGIIAVKYIKGEISSLSYYEEIMKKKVNRIKRACKTKERLKTEKRFIKSYRRGISLLNKINKLAPNLVQNRLIKIVQEDKKIIETLKKSIY
jgi:digeranylgeranylglycerophospholipid reductase